MKNEVRRYKSFTDDFSETANQNFKLPPNYRWLRRDFLSRILSFLIYAAALIFSNVYCRIFLKVRFKNKKVLKESRKTGAFIYGNHTQPVGDVFNPALAVFPNRIYTLASPANLGMKVLGKILPYLGALPVADDFSGMKKLNEAVKFHINRNRCIIIYPEAHVWEYYNDIRPFPDTSFKYPIKHNKPAFVMTTTYKHCRHGRPKCEIWFDGPFFADMALSPKEQQADLCQKVFDTMKKRSLNTDCEYIKYEKETED